MKISVIFQITSDLILACGQERGVINIFVISINQWLHCISYQRVNFTDYTSILSGIDDVNIF